MKFAPRFNAPLLAILASIVGMATPASGQDLTAWGKEFGPGTFNLPLKDRVVQIDAGLAHIYGVLQTGEIRGWGSNTNGLLKDIPLGPHFRAVAGGSTHALALTKSGALKSWGDDEFGKVSSTPTGRGFKAIASGHSHSLALRHNGRIVAWGHDGILSGGIITSTPKGAGYRAISAGAFESVAIDSTGAIKVWGHKTLGNTRDVPPGTDFVSVVSGGFHCLALRSDGSIAAWGSDAYGQVSDAPSGTGYVSVAAGWRYSMALRADGTVEAWGHDDDGQTSKIPTTGGFDLLSGGVHFGAALRYPLLASDTPELSLASGGTVGLHIRGGVEHQGESYMILGSTSGTTQGMQLGAFHLALNYDQYLSFTGGFAANPGFSGNTIFRDFSGKLSTGLGGDFDDAGSAIARIKFPAASNPGLVGMVLNHAVVLQSGATYTAVSDPVSLTLVP